MLMEKRVIGKLFHREVSAGDRSVLEQRDSLLRDTLYDAVCRSSMLLLHMPTLLDITSIYILLYKLSIILIISVITASKVF
jgi:hypothetical protein